MCAPTSAMLMTMRSRPRTSRQRGDRMARLEEALRPGSSPHGPGIRRRCVARTRTGQGRRRSSIMRAAVARTSFVLALLLAAGASAESLKLPDNLVDIRSPQGEAYLLEAHALEA